LANARNKKPSTGARCKRHDESREDVFRRRARLIVSVTIHQRGLLRALLPDLESETMKTARLIVTDPLFGTLTSAQVDVMYRGKVLCTLQGKRAEVGTMLQKAITWCTNRGFEKTKAEYTR
jgi:hypothetical protein